MLIGQVVVEPFEALGVRESVVPRGVAGDVSTRSCRPSPRGSDSPNAVHQGVSRPPKEMLPQATTVATRPGTVEVREEFGELGSMLWGRGDTLLRHDMRSCRHRPLLEKVVRGRHLAVVPLDPLVSDQKTTTARQGGTGDSRHCPVRATTLGTDGEAAVCWPLSVG